MLGFGIQNTAQEIENPTDKGWNPVPEIRNP